MEKEKLFDLLETENLQHQKLHNIVIEAIEEDKLISNKLIEFEDRDPSFASKIADKVAVFGGSWKFIIAFSMFLIV